MSALDERFKETKDERMARLIDRQQELGISDEFIAYIDMMENYLLELENRVKTLEAEKKI